MKEKLITIVTLPWSKAHILKSLLEEKGIECRIEDTVYYEGAPPVAAKVLVLDNDAKLAGTVVDEFLGRIQSKPKTGVFHHDRHILVPVDFSSSSERAFLFAFHLALHLDLKIVLMHSYTNPVVHTFPASDVFVYDSAMFERIEVVTENSNALMKKFVRKMRTGIGAEKWEKVKHEIIVKGGYADDDILDYSEKYKTDLIVMGSGGNTDSASPVGSIAADVIYNSVSPVLIIPEKSPVFDVSEIRKVVYATDFDEKDFAAIDTLMSLLYTFNAKVYCVHIDNHRLETWDLARVEGMKKILCEKYRLQEFECRLLEGNSISEALEQFIESESIDILSLTTRKRSMISRLFNPSLARKMAFHTNIPLLVFHS
jgi:nucleotide-binding universal stress UspA family protein